MLLLLTLALPTLGAALSALLPGVRGRDIGLASGASFAGLLTTHLYFTLSSEGAPSPFNATWVPQLGIDFALRSGGLSQLFALVILLVASCLFPYAGGYLDQHPQRRRFFSYLLLFTAAMLGIVLSDNLIVLFVFWELTSISSYLLIGFKHEDAKARSKALQALLVTGSGGVAMMAGFILLAAAGDSYLISDLVAQGHSLAQHPLAAYALPLLLLGAMTKSAQFPFQFWLPNAMAAPTPVSAFLHSATMVKAGIFLLFTFSPIYNGTPLWNLTLTATGAITLLLGAITGQFQRDLKRILAFTTMAVLGLLTMLIGLGSDMALKSALIFLLGHALYKATLFMTAGSVEHGAGTREVTLLGGLRSAMPLTALAAGLAALSKGGFPPLLGFLGKEYVYKASSGLEFAAPWLTAIALAGNAMLLSLAFKAGLHPFWSKPIHPSADKPWSRLLAHKPHEAPLCMAIGPLVLATTGLAFGLFPSAWSDTLIAPALGGAAGQELTVKIALWHGFSLPLLLSMLTFVLGISIYLSREALWRRESFGRAIERRSTERIYELSFAQFVQKSRSMTLLLQNGSMRSYLWIILSATAALVLAGFVQLGGAPSLPEAKAVGPLPLAISVVIVVSGIVAATASNLLKALAALGLVGYGIAMLFAYFGAPDLAITQLVVETLSVALLLFAALKLPRMRRLSSQPQILADAILACVFGALSFMLVLKASTLELAPTISEQLAAWSYPLAKGKNIVNVILVDFRAIDTFGEIIVLSVAAVGASLCLDKLTTGKLKLARPPIPSSPILRTGARMLLPICIALSLLALYRGHNSPGGGFIGGLIYASGFLFYSMAFGFEAMRKRLAISPKTYIGVGLIVALASGFFGPAAGLPFMTGMWLPAFTLPVLGAVHLGTPLIFDIGVFLAVIGFALQVVYSLQRAAECPTGKDAEPEAPLPDMQPAPRR